jgi:isoquinoline 1-oxidoreductase beta subunit
MFRAAASSATVFSAGALVSGRAAGPEAEGRPNWQPSVYLGIEPDGTVKIVAHRSEMGTGCRTGLPMIVADELEADWARVQVVQALGDVKYGSQIRTARVPCAISTTLCGRRARPRAPCSKTRRPPNGDVPAEECHGQNHFVVHAKSKRKLGYGELAALASTATAPQAGAVRLKTPDQFRYIGKDIPSSI